jgi:uncharacterized membrane protein YtjA (UPF0391 family)
MPSGSSLHHARGLPAAVGRILRVVVRGADGCLAPEAAGFLQRNRGVAMLYYAVVFFVVALIAAVFGFSGIAAGAAGVAKILFVLFLIGAVITFFISLSRRA